MLKIIDILQSKKVIAAFLTFGVFAGIIGTVVLCTVFPIIPKLIAVLLFLGLVVGLIGFVVWIVWFEILVSLEARDDNDHWEM